MEWKGDEGNEQVLAWSCNPVSTRRKPRLASHIQSHNWMQMGIVRILYVCSMQISWWCNIELHGRRLVSFSSLQRCCHTRASRQNGEGQSRYPENRACEEAIGRRGNKCWKLDSVRDALRNEHLAGLYQPQNRCFLWVRCQLQRSKDPLVVILGPIDSSIRSLATVFCRETWRSKYHESQEQLERF